MKKRLKQERHKSAGPRIAIVFMGFWAILVCGWLAGARLNVTTSLPVGLYWVVKQPLEQGSYVRFCPPAQGAFVTAHDRGYLTWGNCDAGYAHMLKRVAGIHGQRVDVRSTATWIDGKPLTLSAPLAADPSGRIMPRPAQDHYVLQTSQLWVVSDTNPLSFDSRYFGPIDTAWITETVRPVLTWGKGGTVSQWRQMVTEKLMTRAAQSP
jgi:conjugative transfer signal peptidase TraF